MDCTWAVLKAPQMVVVMEDWLVDSKAGSRAAQAVVEKENQKVSQMVAR
jgi:hypothetical protein